MAAQPQPFGDELRRGPLAAVAEHVAEALFVVDPGGLITFANPAAERIFRWPAAELLGKSLHEVLHRPAPDGGPAPSECPLCGDPVTGSAVRDHEDVFGRRDGTSVPVSCSRAPIPVDGPGGGAVYIVRDLADPGRADEALRQSERWFRVLAEAIPQIVWVTRPDGWHEFYNRRWYEYTGMGPEQSVGRGWSLPIHPKDRRRAERRWEQATGGSGAYEVEYRLRAKGGAYRWFLARATPVLDPEGRVLRWFGTCTDIDDQKRAEGRTRVSEARLRLAIDAAELGLWSIDLRDGSLEESTRLGAMFGLPPGSAHRDLAAWLDQVHPEDRARVLEEHIRSIRGGADYEAEYRVVWPDGTVHWVASKGRALRDDAGRPVRMIGVATDITRRKSAEAELREAKEVAEAANRAKDRFLAMLGHELRTPLNPVLLSATAALSDRGMPPGLRPTFEVIRDSVLLQARLIDDLLDVSRIASGKMAYQFESVDVHEVIRRAIQGCQSDAQAKRQRFVPDLTATGHHAEADPARLQQLLWNLVKNAVKFSPEGGEIRIATRDRGCRLLVEVADQGVGIEPEALPRIFDAFEQADGSVTRRFGGLGLGLAISRSIAEAHGGSLAASSEGPGRGSTFRLELPVVAPPPSGQQGPGDGQAAEDQPRRRLRVLLVEDDPMTARVTEKLLQGHGYLVTTARSIAEALGANLDECDVVVSDIGLPDGSGLDLMRRIGQLREIPGIALTGFGMDGDVEKSREAGFVAHLTKPIDFGKLDAAIRQVAG